ncbi:hypothetical protein SBRCBS47491_004556 [Sporothrix bragantina]|uniref:PRISE-like Rossmann-fold domain-containing protein n=1 Tax=Sporothrix bragantina TaxID=671064 RepID=A0ABP0BPG3_9PEZI
MSKHALVLGASGITGWATVNELLTDHPDAQQFSKVTALTNRVLPWDISKWPQNSKLNVVSGIDLLDGTQEDLETNLKNVISNINTVTHVFFNAYKFSSNMVEQSRSNADMLERCVTAAESLCPAFEFIVLPTGGKSYGFHLLESFPFRDSLPLKEDLPRIPEPHASELFYYWQVDRLKDLASGKKWTYCEIRPDMVVGFVPNNNAHCLAQVLAVYLSLYAHINGQGSSVPFPGNDKSWTIQSNDSSQDIVARFSIFASLRPHAAGEGRAFNVADRVRPSSWSVKWPVICSFFSLKGVGPTENSVSPSEFMEKNAGIWQRLVAEKGLRPSSLDNDKANVKFPEYIMSLFTFNRVMSLEAMRHAGFTEEADEKTSWFLAFQRFRDAKIIP